MRVGPCSDPEDRPSFALLASVTSTPLSGPRFADHTDSIMTETYQRLDFPTIYLARKMHSVDMATKP